MFEFLDFMTALTKELWKSLTDTKLYVYDMWHLPKEVRGRFKSDMRIVVEILAEKDPEIDFGTQEIEHPEALTNFMKALTNGTEYERVLEKLEKGEKIKMNSYFGRLLDERGEIEKENGKKIGEERGKEIGKEIGGMEMLKGLIQDGILTVAEAAQRMQMPEDNFVKHMNEINV